MTTRRMMLAVAIAAFLVTPPLFPGPAESGVTPWLVATAVTNLPAIVIIPILLGLRGARLLLAMAACTAIAGAQVALLVPPNTPALLGYLAISGIARRARDIRDLASALAAVAGGVLVGVACGHSSCQPGVEQIVGAITGMIIRVASRPRVRATVSAEHEHGPYAAP
jgi:hypothetical protein